MADIKEMLAAWDGAVVRFFEEPKQKVATCVFGTPAWLPVEGRKDEYVALIRPEGPAVGGRIDYAQIQFGDGRQSERIACGPSGSECLFRFKDQQVPAGAALEVPPLRMSVRPAGQMSVRPAGQDELARQARAAIERVMRPKPNGTAVVVRKAKQAVGSLPRAQNGTVRLVWEHLRVHGPQTATELAAALEMDEDAVVLELNKLYKDGQIKNA